MNRVAGKLLLVVVVFSCLTLNAGAQTSAKEEVPKGWHTMDIQSNGYYGISLDKAYERIYEGQVGAIPGAVMNLFR